MNKKTAKSSAEKTKATNREKLDSFSKRTPKSSLSFAGTRRLTAEEWNALSPGEKQEFITLQAKPFEGTTQNWKPALGDLGVIDTVVQVMTAGQFDIRSYFKEDFSNRASFPPSSVLNGLADYREVERDDGRVVTKGLSTRGTPIAYYSKRAGLWYVKVEETVKPNILRVHIGNGFIYDSAKGKSKIPRDILDFDDSDFDNEASLRLFKSEEFARAMGKAITGRKNGTAIRLKIKVTGGPLLAKIESIYNVPGEFLELDKALFEEGKALGFDVDVACNTGLVFLSPPMGFLKKIENGQASANDLIVGHIQSLPFASDPNIVLQLDKKSRNLIKYLDAAGKKPNPTDTVQYRIS